MNKYPKKVPIAAKKKLSFTVTTDLVYDQRMQRICNSLSTAGFDVCLIGRKLPDSKSISSQNFRQKRLPCWFHTGKLFYIEYNIRLFFELLFLKTDVLTAIDLDTMLPNYVVSRLRRLPLVYDAHEYFSELPEVVTRPRIKKIWEFVARCTIPHATAAYTVGDALAEIFTKRYQIPFKTVRNIPRQLEKKRAENRSIEGEKILLYQGVLNVGRGLPELILAMRHLKNVQLWLAGEGDLSERLRQLVASEGLSEKVQFLGYVLPADLKKLTDRAYLGINLLENLGLNYYYSLANKFFDYLHAEVPSLNPAFPEYLHLLSAYQTGITVSDLAPETIAAAIKTLLDDEEKYAFLQAECRRAAEKLHWQAEAQELIAIYEGL